MYKKMKPLIIGLALLAIPLLSTGQDPEKQLIGIADFKIYENGGATGDDARLLQSFVTDAFINSKRFTILERQYMEIINTELEQQKSETTLNTDFYVEQGKILGAKFLLIGTVSSLSIEDKTNAGTNALAGLAGGLAKTANKALSTDKKVARIGISFRIVDVETGVVNAAQTITAKSDDGAVLGASDRGAAVQSAKNSVIKETNKFIEKYLPIELSVLKITEQRKGKVEQFYINGGNDLGIKKGDKIVLKKVEFEDFGNGRTKIETSLGEARVLEVKGAKVSLCEVKKGGKMMLESIENNENIVCQTLN